MSASPDSLSRTRLYAGSARGAAAAVGNVATIGAVMAVRSGSVYLELRQARRLQAVLAIAATSAAKSSFFLSIPSPTTYSSNPVTDAPFVSRYFSIDRSGFLTNG